MMKRRPHTWHLLCSVGNSFSSSSHCKMCTIISEWPAVDHTFPLSAFQRCAKTLACTFCFGSIAPNSNCSAVKVEPIGTGAMMKDNGTAYWWWWWWWRHMMAMVISAIGQCLFTCNVYNMAVVVGNSCWVRLFAALMQMQHQVHVDLRQGATLKAVLRRRNSVANWPVSPIGTVITSPPCSLPQPQQHQLPEHRGLMSESAGRQTDQTWLVMKQVRECCCCCCLLTFVPHRVRYLPLPPQQWYISSDDVLNDVFIC